jgi:hypothetical protein
MWIAIHMGVGGAAGATRETEGLRTGHALADNT